MFRGLRSWVGFTQLGFPYDRPTRRSGKSKYNLRKLVDLALLGFVGFTDFPLRFIGVFGFGVGLFACLLTLVDAEHAGRPYAADGGVYIVAALGWLWIVEGFVPDR